MVAKAKTKNIVSISEKNLGRLLQMFEQQNKKMDKLINLLAGAQTTHTEQSHAKRAKTEQLTEQTEQLLSAASAVGRDGFGVEKMGNIRGKHRELLALFINQGFHTYEQIASKLHISQSRARAYVAELKNDFHVPLRQVRDPEGYKIGMDVGFVEQILASK